MTGQEIQDITIRFEQAGDETAVYRVNQLAFERHEEAMLVDELRESDAELISLVAEKDGLIVGHVLFSPMRVVLDEYSLEIPAIGLGPVSVLPASQNEGIGSALIEAGLEACRHSGYALAFVLGHPNYYPRFGFAPARPLGIRCAYEDVPDDAFMAMELREGALADVKGTAYYRPEFDGV